MPWWFIFDRMRRHEYGRTPPRSQDPDGGSQACCDQHPRWRVRSFGCRGIRCQRTHRLPLAGCVSKRRVGRTRCAQTRWATAQARRRGDEVDLRNGGEEDAAAEATEVSPGNPVTVQIARAQNPGFSDQLQNLVGPRGLGSHDLHMLHYLGRYIPYPKCVVTLRMRNGTSKSPFRPRLSRQPHGPRSPCVRAASPHLRTLGAGCAALPQMA